MLDNTTRGLIQEAVLATLMGQERSEADGHRVRSSPATTIPTLDDMRRVWRADRCVNEGSAAVYIRRIELFEPTALSIGWKNGKS